MLISRIIVDSSITEAEEAVNNSFEERDEHERVMSGVSKCSNDTEDDKSVSELTRLRTLFHVFITRNAFQMKREAFAHCAGSGRSETACYQHSQIW